jgi:hypothetical protein
MRRPHGHPELGSSRNIEGPVLLDLCRRCMAAGAQHVRFPLRGLSMLPTLETGDVATIEPLDDAPPVAGEIILFEGPGGRPVIHRVVRTAQRGAAIFVVTASDTNPTSLDEPIPLSCVVGRVTSAERGGRFLPLTAPAPPALSNLRARFRLGFAGRARPAGALRRAFVAMLRTASPLAQRLRVLECRLRHPAAEEVAVAVREDAEQPGHLIVEASAGDGARTRLELVRGMEDDSAAWAILGPRLWPTRPGPAPEAVLRQAVQLAEEGGAARVYAITRRGWHVRRYLLAQAGFEPCNEPKLLSRLVQQAQEGDSRACDWLLLGADLSAPRSPR